MQGRTFNINNPYSGGTNQYKGQLHVHTTNSFDVSGSNSPTQVVTAYKNAGYDFVCVTDHNTLTSDPSVAGITFIPGIEELSNTELQRGHMTFINTSVNSTKHPSQLIINDHKYVGALAVLAHPNLVPYQTSQSECLTLENYNFIEIMNRNGGYAEELYSAEDKWDTLLSYGKKVFGIGVDDCHDVDTPANFDNAWVIVNADDNTVSDICAALEAGNFYTSYGADVDISVSGNDITATCTNSSTIEFIGKHGRVLQTDTSSTSDTYTITGDEMYVRVRVTKDSDSTQAFSNPVFLDTEDNVEPVAPLASPKANLLNNSNFDIWQRGTSFSASGSAVQSADRWRMGGTSTSTTLSRQDVSDEYGQYCARLTMVTKGGSPDSNILQGLETKDVIPLRNKSVTFSVLLRRNATFNAGNFRVNIYQGTGTDEQTASTNRVDTYDDYSYDTLGTSKWTRVSITTTVRNDTKSLCVIARMNDSNTPDGSYIELRQAQLNIGSRPQEYVPIPTSQELLNCQRYYYRTGRNGSGGGVYSPVSSLSVANLMKFYFKFPTQQRTNVAGNIVGTRGTDWTIRTLNNSTYTNTISVGTETGPLERGLLSFTSSNLFTAGTAYTVCFHSDDAYVEWDAELG